MKNVNKAEQMYWIMRNAKQKQKKDKWWQQYKNSKGFPYDIKDKTNKCMEVES